MAKPVLTFPVIGGKLTKANYALGAKRAGASIKAKQLEGSLARVKSIASQWAGILEQRQKAAFFASGHGLRGGSTWSPLKPSTLRKHRREGWSPLPLMASGKLRNSIKGTSSAKKVGKRGTTYTIKVIAGEFYGRFHATGYMNALTGRPVPARPPIEFTSKDLSDLASAMATALAT